MEIFLFTHRRQRSVARVVYSRLGANSLARVNNLRHTFTPQNYYPGAYLMNPNIGEWRVSSVLPAPRYICTPHGRHGSKLRTVRMMSMPLKLSGPFSSKIGVPCTESS